MQAEMKALLVMAAAFVGHCGPAFAQSDDLLTSARKGHQVTAAVAVVPPFIVISRDGEAQGLTIDLVNRVLKGMGVPPLKYMITSWDSMLPALQARQADMAPAGILITEARCKAVIFSAPTAVVHDSLFVLPGNPKGLTTYSQVVQNPSIKIAVLAGSGQEAYARKVGVKENQLVRVTDIQAGATTVTGGRADAFAVGQMSILHPEQRGLNLVINKEVPLNAIGVAFRKEDVAFRDEFNRQLNLLRSDGTWQKQNADAGIPNWEELAKLTKASDVFPSCN